MFNIDEITHNYILIEILHFLEDEKILYNLLTDWLDTVFVNKNEKIKFYFIFLQYKKIVIIEKWRYIFIPEFRQELLKLWYSKFLIFDWYKDYFSLWNKSLLIKKNNNKVAKWSYDLSEKIYNDYFSNLLKNNSINSLLDLWCWNSNFLIFLSIQFPDKLFYWIEIDENSYLEWINKIKKLWLKNIKIYNDNILNIDNISIWNIDVISSFFVLHELPDVKNILNKIFESIKPKYFIIREFTPPNDILNWNFQNNDQFFLTYIFIHFLSRQKTNNIY